MNFKTLEQYLTKEKEFFDKSKSKEMTIKSLYLHLGINKYFEDDIKMIIKDYHNCELNGKEYSINDYLHNYPYISLDDEILKILTEKTDRQNRIYWTLPKLRRLLNYLIMSREKVLNEVEKFGLYNLTANPQTINSYLKANNKDIYGSDAYILSKENKFKPINIVFKNESSIKLTLPEKELKKD